MRRVAGEVNEELYTHSGGRARHRRGTRARQVHPGRHLRQCARYPQAGPDESGALGTGLPVRGQARSVTCWPPTDSRRDRSSAAATSSTIWSWARARTAVSTIRYLRSGTRGLLRLRIDRHTNETMTGAIDRQRGRLARLTGQAGRSAAPGPHRRPGGVSMHPAQAIPAELIVSLSSAAATSLGPFTAGGWPGAAAGRAREAEQHSPAKVEQGNGAASPLTFALVLITVTLAARLRLNRPGGACSAGRIAGGAQHHDRTAGHVECRRAGQHRRPAGCTGAGPARQRRRIDNNVPAVCVIGARQDELHGVAVRVE